MTDYKLEEHRDKVFFRDIALGEMFLDEVDIPCIRTFDIEFKDGREFNAVRIADVPFCCCFQGNERVVRIKKAVFTV